MAAAILISLIVIVPLALLGWDLARTRSADVSTGVAYNPRLVHEPSPGPGAHRS